MAAMFVFTTDLIAHDGHGQLAYSKRFIGAKPFNCTGVCKQGLLAPTNWVGLYPLEEAVLLFSFHEQTWRLPIDPRRRSIQWFNFAKQNNFSENYGFGNS